MELEPRAFWVKRLAGRCKRQLMRIEAMQTLGWRQPPIPLIKRLRPLASLMPLHQEPIAAGLQILRLLNETALQALDNQLEASKNPIPVLPVIVGCRKRRMKAEQRQHQFEATGQWPRPLLVEGDHRLPDWRIDYCAKAHRLRLPIDDGYSHLPKKMMWLALALTLLKTSTNMLKMDDDAQPGAFENLQTSLARLNGMPTAAAVGYPIRVSSRLSLDRGWHMGKSGPPKDHRVFCSLGTREWLSGGVGYLLSSEAVRRLGEMSLHSWGFVETMLYEDVCISMLLEAADLPVSWLEHPSELGLRNERNSEIAAGQWRNEEAPC